MSESFSLRSILLVTIPLILINTPYGGEAQLVSCSGVGHLSCYNETVVIKGFSYVRWLVNRTVPVQISYTVYPLDPEVQSVTWMHDDETIKVDDNPRSELNYAVEEKNGKVSVTLTIGLPNPRVSGNWKMTLTTTDSKSYTGVCQVTAPPLFHHKLGAVRTNEGQPCTVSCDVEAHPLPSQIFWYRIVDSPSGQKLVPFTNATFKPKNNVKNAQMELADASGFGGLYMCSASTNFGTDNMVFEIRVKTKLTYLWPCIGIILELIVLGVTIGVYEHSQWKRRKLEAARSANESGK